MKKTWITLLLAAVLLCAAAMPSYASEQDGAGVLIYQETFDSYTDQTDTAQVLAQIGWTAQTRADGAYTDPVAKLMLSDGRLEVANTGNDSYYLMLTDEQMRQYAGQTITIQYELTYTTAANTSRYLCILANYSGQNYNSFHFRNRGDGNNQVHIGGSWRTYDAANPVTDAYASGNDGTNGSSIAMKLLGQKLNSNVAAFSELPVTIRYVLPATGGPSVYMKLAEDGEDKFVCVSVPDAAADTTTYGSWDAYAVCFKVGGAQNGYVDNIAIWTGDGDFPQPEPEVSETETDSGEVAPSEPAEPSAPDADAEADAPAEREAKVREPHTIVNKIALWSVALLGGFVIYKKEKGRAQN